MLCDFPAAWPWTGRGLPANFPRGNKPLPVRQLPFDYLQLEHCFSPDFHARRIAIVVRAAYPVAMKSLEEMIRDLPPDAQRKVEDFVKELAKSSAPAPKRKLDQRWAGALKRYRDQYTSLQLQRKALEWRGD